MTTPTFIPTRAAGLERLAAFLPRAGRDYAARRNFDLGPEDRDNVSMLSPWIRHRLVREDEVVSRVLARHGSTVAAAFVQEVVWRTYWKGWLEMRPVVWQRYRSALADALRDLDRDPGLRRRWQEATTGRTGIACFDAWAAELLDLGYLHNHTRMWFASIWIFTLELPWVLGADVFFRHLLDGDPASNTLSWRWVAGLQTPGKTYLARPDNIAHYTGGRFGNEPRLATAAVAVEEALPVPPPAPLPAAAADVPDEPVAVLITEDDCEPLSLGIRGDRVRVAAAIACTPRRSPLPAGAAAGSFSRGACADALTRLAAEAGCPTVLLPDDADAAAVADVVRQAGASLAVVAYAPVGPAAEWLAAVEAPLAARGITLVRVRRRWDGAFWPHALKGYFPFKQKVPDTLRRLGIGLGDGQ